jgi:hypothetical protein
MGAWGAMTVAFLTATSGPGTVLGQELESESAPHPGESLEVSLVTIGQGDLVWERFGHNAILFRNRVTGQEVAYHWGVFDFDQVDFVPRLIKGTMLYSMAPSDFPASLQGYRLAGRSVRVQDLALTPEQRWELLRLVEENYLPRNRDYRYDYYRDNCSTRVRDMLDRALEGKLRDRFGSDTTATSYRWHTRRILQEMPLYYVGIQWVLGPYADRPITVWEQMFLPRTLMEGIREIDVADGEGGSRPLVAREAAVFESGREGPPSSPPFALPLFLLVGVLWGGGLIWASGEGRASGIGRRLVFALLAGTWVSVAGLGGSLLLGAWLFTDHFFWYRNANLFQANPLFFLLIPAVALYLFKGRIPRWGRELAMILGVVAVLGLLLELVPGLGQRNGEVLAWTIPMNLALWISARRLPTGPIPDLSRKPGPNGAL